MNARSVARLGLLALGLAMSAAVVCGPQELFPATNSLVNAASSIERSAPTGFSIHRPPGPANQGSRLRANQHQVGYIGARNQQDQSHCGKQQQQAGPGRAYF